MSKGEPVFSRRLLVGWIAGAAAVFAVSLYLMGQSEMTGTDSSGTSTFSRSAIGHAGIAELLQQVGFSVVKGRSNPLQNLAKGSAVVVAEPRMAALCSMKPCTDIWCSPRAPSCCCSAFPS